MRKAATVGTFDGVHIGHRAVIDTLKNAASGKGLSPLVITFDRHPLEVIAPQRAPKRLMSPYEEECRLRSLGVEVEMIPFTRGLMSLTAREWMQRMHCTMDVDILVAGYDNTFGCDGIDMSIADYKAIGRETGIEVMAAPFVPGASSSEVRRALLAGETGKAAGMLGENYRLGGEVVKGRQLGRTLGFPTANVNAPTDRLVPGKGVYAADAVLPGGETFPAVVNVGVRPTIGDNLSPTVEAHLIGWEGDLYGQTLTLLFADRIRGERRFPSLDALKAQIAADTDAAIKAMSGRR